MKRNLKQKILKILGLEETYPKSTKLINSFAKTVSKTIYSIPFKFDIVMISLDRPVQLERTVKHLYKNLKTDFNLIIIDNASQQETIKYLKKIEEKYKNIKVIYLSTSIDESKARALALENSTCDYVAFLDDTTLIAPYFFENLFLTLLSDKKIAGVQSKVSLPNALLELANLKAQTEDKWINFSEEHSGLRFDNPATLKESHVDWISLRGSLFRSEIIKKYKFDLELISEHQDKDFSLRIKKDGIEFKNSIKSHCIHLADEFMSLSNEDRKYPDSKATIDAMRNSAKRFFQKHRKIITIGNEENYIKNNLNFDSNDKYKEFIES